MRACCRCVGGKLGLEHLRLLTGSGDAGAVALTITQELSGMHNMYTCTLSHRGLHAMEVLCCSVLRFELAVKSGEQLPSRPGLPLIIAVCTLPAVV